MMEKSQQQQQQHISSPLGPKAAGDVLQMIRMDAKMLDGVKAGGLHSAAGRKRPGCQPFGVSPGSCPGPRG